MVSRIVPERLYRKANHRRNVNSLLKVLEANFIAKGQVELVFETVELPESLTDRLALYHKTSHHYYSLIVTGYNVEEILNRIVEEYQGNISLSNGEKVSSDYFEHTVLIPEMIYDTASGTKRITLPQLINYAQNIYNNADVIVPDVCRVAIKLNDDQYQRMKEKITFLTLAGSDEIKASLCESIINMRNLEE